MSALIWGSEFPAPTIRYATERASDTPYSIQSRIEFAEANIARLVLKGDIAGARESAVQVAQLRDCQLTTAEWMAGYEAVRA